MKKIISTLVLSYFVLAVFSQQDPEAKMILDRVAEKSKSYTTIQADLTILIENRIEDWETETKGSIIIKGKKYYMETGTDKYYFNGKTVWSYNTADNEVVITANDPDNESFAENPALVFQFYNRDFKYKYVKETKYAGRAMHEIDLFPKDLNQPYSRIKIMIDKQTENLSMVTAVSKEGIDFSAIITNMQVNKAVEDSKFEFNPDKIKGIEVIDMRSLD